MTMPATEYRHPDWHVDALWRQLSPLLPGIGIEVLARADSTNSMLLDRVRNDSSRGSSSRSAEASYGRRAYDLQPCLLVAEHQTQGRGRMGRQWQSGPGGSSLTFSLSLPLEPTDWSGLSLAAGCAIAEALDPLREAGQAPRLQLKWPNDLWLDGRKLGGILIETVSAGAQRVVVVGVGLNIVPLDPNPSFVNSSIADFTPLAHFSSGYASLDELQPDIGAPAVLAQVAPALVRALLAFQQTGFAAVQPEFERRDLLRDQHVCAGNLDGIARGVNAQGELLIQTADGMQTVGGGEVSVRLLPTAGSGL
ncbi:bifunctional biotin--[acetyl-CoA-carboxylase] ligase/biotin operon repressor BirA [soil metagenome]